MRINEHYIVDTEKGTRHPKGTEVIVVFINKSDTDSKPILVRAYQGKTEYWYSADELKSFKEWAYENRN